MLQLSLRDKMVLSGLYLSKFDLSGIKKLGFDGFTEAFNVIGLALGARPASIKNYRDEFDPLFANPRKGWHGRPTRSYCLALLDAYSGLDFTSFTALIQSFFQSEEQSNGDYASSENDERSLENRSFAQRLITGIAAERYFEAVYETVPEFAGRKLRNTTQSGCGYDFKLIAEESDREYLAIEVKGLAAMNGNLSLTSKEFEAASVLADRFYLFVVKNFREKPIHSLYNNPIASALTFKRMERVVVHTSWLVRV